MNSDHAAPFSFHISPHPQPPFAISWVASLPTYYIPVSLLPVLPIMIVQSVGSDEIGKSPKLHTRQASEVRLDVEPTETGLRPLGRLRIKMAPLLPWRSRR